MAAPSTSRPPLRGYNHNIRYNIRIYHVQTEDSGLETPHVFTHLFLNGMIVSTLRTDYRHLLEEEDRDDQLRKLMQGQHKQIMRQLRRGELDDKIIGLMGTIKPPTTEVMPLSDAPPPAEAPSPAEAPPAPPPKAPAAPPAKAPAAPPAEAPPAPPAEAPAAPPPKAPAAPPAKAPAAPPAKAPVVPPPKAQPELEPLSALATLVESGIDRDSLTEIEERSIKRGTAISMELASLPVGQRIPMEHPAFSGIPLLEMDEEGDDDALELDLDAIDKLDLDAEPGVLMKPGDAPGDMPFQGSDSVELALDHDAVKTLGQPGPAAEEPSRGALISTGSSSGAGEEFDLDDGYYTEDDYTNPGIGVPGFDIPGEGPAPGLEPEPAPKLSFEPEPSSGHREETRPPSLPEIPASTAKPEVHRSSRPSLPDIPLVEMKEAPPAQPPPKRRRPRSGKLKRPPSMKIKPEPDDSVEVPPKVQTQSYPAPPQRFRTDDHESVTDPKQKKEDDDERK